MWCGQEVIKLLDEQLICGTIELLLLSFGAAEDAAPWHLPRSSQDGAVFSCTSAVRLAAFYRLQSFESVLPDLSASSAFAK